MTLTVMIVSVAVTRPETEVHTSGDMTATVSRNIVNGFMFIGTIPCLDS